MRREFLSDYKTFEPSILVLHNERNFTKVQEDYNILKDFVKKRTFIGQTCRFKPKTMNLITSHFVTCLCNISSG